MGSCSSRKFMTVPQPLKATEQNTDQSTRLAFFIGSLPAVGRQDHKAWSRPVKSNPTVSSTARVCLSNLASGAASARRCRVYRRANAAPLALPCQNREGHPDGSTTIAPTRPTAEGPLTGRGMPNSSPYFTVTVFPDGEGGGRVEKNHRPAFLTGLVVEVDVHSDWLIHTGHPTALRDGCGIGVPQKVLATYTNAKNTSRNKVI